MEGTCWGLACSLDSKVTEGPCLPPQARPSFSGGSWDSVLWAKRRVLLPPFYLSCTSPQEADSFCVLRSSSRYNTASFPWVPAWTPPQTPSPSRGRVLPSPHPCPPPTVTPLSVPHIFCSSFTSLWTALSPQENGNLLWWGKALYHHPTLPLLTHCLALSSAKESPPITWVLPCLSQCSVWPSTKICLIV